MHISTTNVPIPGTDCNKSSLETRDYALRRVESCVYHLLQTTQQSNTSNLSLEDATATTLVLGKYFLVT
jgi:hypothetical protein